MKKVIGFTLLAALSASVLAQESWQTATATRLVAIGANPLEPKQKSDLMGLRIHERVSYLEKLQYRRINAKDKVFMIDEALIKAEVWKRQIEQLKEMRAAAAKGLVLDMGAAPALKSSVDEAYARMMGRNGPQPDKIGLDVSTSWTLTDGTREIQFTLRGNDTVTLLKALSDGQSVKTYGGVGLLESSFPNGGAAPAALHVFTPLSFGTPEGPSAMLEIAEAASLIHREQEPFRQEVLRLESAIVDTVFKQNSELEEIDEIHAGMSVLKLPAWLRLKIESYVLSNHRNLGFDSDSQIVPFLAKAKLSGRRNGIALIAAQPPTKHGTSFIRFQIAR